MGWFYDFIENQTYTFLPSKKFPFNCFLRNCAISIKKTSLVINRPTPMFTLFIQSAFLLTQPSGVYTIMYIHYIIWLKLETISNVGTVYYEQISKISKLKCER